MVSPDPPPAVVAALRAAGCVFAEDEAVLLAAAAASRDELDGMVARRPLTVKCPCVTNCRAVRRDGANPSR